MPGLVPGIHVFEREPNRQIAPPSSVVNSRRFMSLLYLGSLLSNCCATRTMSSLR